MVGFEFVAMRYQGSELHAVTGVVAWKMGFPYAPVHALIHLLDQKHTARSLSFQSGKILDESQGFQSRLDSELKQVMVGCNQQDRNSKIEAPSRHQSYGVGNK